MKIKKESTYSDLDLNMIPHPLTGDLTPKTDIDSVKVAIKHLFFLDPFDFPFDGDKKMNVKRILFDQNGHLTEARLRTQIEWLIKKCEPRVNLHKIEIQESQDNLGYHITITYQIKSIMVDDSFQFFVQKVR